jgi:hypothetical protein
MLERVIGGRGEADAAQIARHVLSIARRAPPHARLKLLNARRLWCRSPTSSLASVSHAPLAAGECKS